MTLSKADLDDPFYDVQDVATLFKVSKQQARKWFHDGEIPGSFNLNGKGWRSRRSNVLIFAQRTYGDDTASD